MQHRINTVTKQYRTETGHRLMDYDGKCSHAHGHSYLWEITVTGNLDALGMVLDFKDLKEAIAKVLEPFDHAMILQEDDQLADFLLEIPATNGDIQRVITFSWNPTAENFAKHAGLQISRLLPEDVYIERVKVWETATSFATWEYQA